MELNAFLAAAGDAVVVCDPQGLITVWNPAAERLFGYTQEQALGQSLDIIIPARLRARHWEGFAQSMASGSTRYGNEVLRVPAVDKAGRALSIAFSVGLLFDTAQKVSAVLAIMRDETTRFNQDRALRKQLAALQTQAAAAGG